MPGVHTIGAGAVPAKPFWTQNSDKEITAQADPAASSGSPTAREHRAGQQNRCAWGKAAPLRSWAGAAPGSAFAHHPTSAPRAAGGQPRLVPGPSISLGSAGEVIRTTKAAPSGAFCLVNIRSRPPPPPRHREAPVEAAGGTRPHSAPHPHNSRALSFEMLMFRSFLLGRDLSQ